MKLIRDLNDIRNYSKLGLMKGWVLNDSKSGMIGDVLQKISFSISDLNKEIENYEFSPKSIIYQIVLTSWILEGFEELMCLFRRDVLSGFKYDENRISAAKEYIKTIRSFVVAHPLTTNRHPKYGLDGDYVCTDIFNYGAMEVYFVSNDNVLIIDVNGMRKTKNHDDKQDYYLKVYSSKKDGSMYFSLIGCSLKDIYDCVNVLIDCIYDLDKYLVNTKKKDYL